MIEGTLCGHLWFLTIATAKPMTVMMPKGTSSIPALEPSIISSGNAVALKLVSFVVIVTVINVLEVVFPLVLAAVESKGSIVEVEVAVVERKLAVVCATLTAMLGRVGLKGCVFSLSVGLVMLLSV